MIFAERSTIRVLCPFSEIPDKYVADTIIVPFTLWRFDQPFGGIGIVGGDFA